MTQNDDWRLQGQEQYLQGATLFWRKYSRYRGDWDHDHCEFCSKKFSENPSKDSLSEGYATADNYRWVCKQCFDDFAEMFEWKTG